MLDQKPMKISGGHLIDGQWRRNSGGFSHNNPSTGVALAPDFGEAGDAEVDAALTAAVSAFQATRNLEPRWPARFLEAIAEQISNLGDALLERANQETALPPARLVSERGRTVNQLKMFADLVRDGAWLEATIETAEANRQP